MNKIKQFKNKIKKKYLWRKYHDMAHYFCKGNGLEVGALCYPYLFNEDCKLKYADIFENSKLRKILKDIPLDNLYHNNKVAYYLNSKIRFCKVIFNNRCIILATYELIKTLILF